MSEVSENQDQLDGLDGLDEKIPLLSGGDQTTRIVNIQDLDEDGNVIEKPEEESAKEIKDLEELHKEQYEFKGIGKCSKCRKERGLFVYKTEEICAVCIKEVVNANLDKSVESRSAELVG